jgi:sigma54-dependent transcription regulator
VNLPMPTASTPVDALRQAQAHWRNNRAELAASVENLTQIIGQAGRLIARCDAEVERIEAAISVLTDAGFNGDTPAREEA